MRVMEFKDIIYTKVAMFEVIDALDDASEDAGIGVSC